MLDYNKGDVLPVLDHGYVILRDHMGSDEAIENAARISYDGTGSSTRERLLRYLMRHRHTSPFEMGEMVFEIKMPIFVARQWVRHRTASMNEVSARYTQLPAEMHIPEEDALEPQSKSNKQGREGGRYERHKAAFMRRTIRQVNQSAYDAYEDMLAEYDLTRELARGVLPLNTYTKFVWKIDLHNLLHFLKLRTDPHAQKEIREYAEVIEKLVALYFPMTYRAWVDYSKEAYLLSRMERDLVRQLLRFYMVERPRLDEAAAQARLEEIDKLAATRMTKRELEAFTKEFIPHEPEPSTAVDAG